MTQCLIIFRLMIICIRISELIVIFYCFPGNFIKNWIMHFMMFNTFCDCIFFSSLQKLKNILKLSDVIKFYALVVLLENPWKYQPESEAPNICWIAGRILGYLTSSEKKWKPVDHHTSKRSHRFAWKCSHSTHFSKFERLYVQHN